MSPAPVERLCAAPNCGVVFEPAVWNQRFHARSCKKRLENARRRGIDPERTAPPVPFNCAQCGRRCAPGEDGVAPNASRFCSLEHKRRWHHRAEQEAT